MEDVRSYYFCLLSRDFFFILFLLRQSFVVHVWLKSCKNISVSSYTILSKVALVIQDPSAALIVIKFCVSIRHCGFPFWLNILASPELVNNREVILFFNKKVLMLS